MIMVFKLGQILTLWILVLKSHLISATLTFVWFFSRVYYFRAYAFNLIYWILVSEAVFKKHLTEGDFFGQIK